MKASDFPVKDWSLYRPAQFKYIGRWIYNWFSNFQTHPVIIDGEEWPAIENYYQSRKTTSSKLQEDMKTMSAAESKKFGRKLKMRDDWEDIKVEVMYKALKAKWSQPEWKKKLLDTNDEILVEWNNWGDDIWGAKDTTNQGQNILGCLLVKLRNEFVEEEKNKKVEE